MTAGQVRRDLAVGTGPIPNVVRLLEAHGVLVVRQTARGSIRALVYRAHKLGWLSDLSYRRANEQLERWGHPEPGSLGPRRAPASSEPPPSCWSRAEPTSARWPQRPAFPCHRCMRSSLQDGRTSRRLTVGIWPYQAASQRASMRRPWFVGTVRPETNRRLTIRSGPVPP